MPDFNKQNDNALPPEGKMVHISLPSLEEHMGRALAYKVEQEAGINLRNPHGSGNGGRGL